MTFGRSVYRCAPAHHVGGGSRYTKMFRKSIQNAFYQVPFVHENDFRDECHRGMLGGSSPEGSWLVFRCLRRAGPRALGKGLGFTQFSRWPRKAEVTHLPQMPGAEDQGVAQLLAAGRGSCPAARLSGGSFCSRVVAERSWSLLSFTGLMGRGRSWVE